jgi:hypothetical protein
MPADTPHTPFRRRWFLAVTANLFVGVIFGLVVWFFLPPRQSLAYAKLHIPAKPESVLGQHPEQQIDFLVRAQVALIKSRAVLEKALERPGIVQEMDAEWLATHLRVSFPDSMEIMRVSLERPNAEEARLLVAAVVDVYMEEVVNKHMNRLTQRQKELDAIVEAKRKELDDLAAKHEDLVAKYEEKRKELKHLEDRIVKLVVQQIIQPARKPEDLEAIQAQIRKSVEEHSEVDAALRGLNLDLDRERKELARFVEKAGDQIDKLKVELKDPPRVQLLEPARIEQIDETPRRLRLSLLAGLGTFAAMMIGFVLFSRLAVRKSS